MLLIYNISTITTQNLYLKYFQIPFNGLISLGITIFIGYFISQWLTDNRKKKDIVEKYVNKTMDNFNESYMYEINNIEDIQKIRIVQRSIYNRLHVLKTYAPQFDFEEEIQYIFKQFEWYWDFISQHINELEYLKQSRAILFNSTSAILSKLETIITIIYK